MSSPSPNKPSGGGESDRRVLGRLAKSLVLQNYSQVIATISTMATLVYFYFALTGSTLRERKRRRRPRKGKRKRANGREREREVGRRSHPFFFSDSSSLFKANLLRHTVIRLKRSPFVIHIRIYGSEEKERGFRTLCPAEQNKDLSLSVSVSVLRAHMLYLAWLLHTHHDVAVLSYAVAFFLSLLVGQYRLGSSVLTAPQPLMVLFYRSSEAWYGGLAV